MLSGQMLKFGCSALSIFTAAASAAPSWEADKGGIRFLPGSVRWWPADGLGDARHLAVARPKRKIWRLLVSSREVAPVTG